LTISISSDPHALETALKGDSGVVHPRLHRPRRTIDDFRNFSAGQFFEERQTNRLAMLIGQTLETGSHRTAVLGGQRPAPGVAFRG
jgi:hypothetical protein